MLNRCLTFTLGIAIVLTGCVALSLTEIHGSVTIRFGKADARLIALANAVPASQLGAP
jgi:hypothetical protein